MKPPSTDETSIVGAWLNVKGNLVADEACDRIDWLVSKYLVKLGVAKNGWETLFQDPTDARCWLLHYPDSNSHGGGPPALKVIENGAAWNCVSQGR
jgi:Immunity protein 27